MPLLNSAEPDQTPRFAAFDQVLHYLIKTYKDKTKGGGWSTAN